MFWRSLVRWFQRKREFRIMVSGSGRYRRVRSCAFEAWRPIDRGGRTLVARRDSSRRTHTIVTGPIHAGMRNDFSLHFRGLRGRPMFRTCVGFDNGFARTDVTASVPDTISLLQHTQVVSAAVLDFSGTRVPGWRLVPITAGETGRFAVFTIMRLMVRPERRVVLVGGRPARVAKSADATDLKSVFAQAECGFKSRPGHQKTKDFFLQA